jgi:ribosome maturation factor RimP
MCFVKNAADARGKKINKIIEELALTVTGNMGIELVGVDYFPAGKRSRVVVYIDKPGGVFIEDCEEVNKSLGKILDHEDPIPSSYILEVSSPGIERPLKKPDDFRRFKGNYIKVKTYNKINGRRNFTGFLKEFSVDSLCLETDEGEQFNISLHEIAKANLWFRQNGREKR